MPPTESLTPAQQQVLLLLASGSTITAAALAAGIHRNTITNWRRSSDLFHNQWTSMQYDQAMYWRDEMQSAANIAMDALLKALEDPTSPPSVRLRAALAVLDKVTSLPPKQPALHIVQPPPDPKPAQNLVEMPKPAQSCTTDLVAALCVPSVSASRNAMCPCGSGQKFKRCCLMKAAAA